MIVGQDAPSFELPIEDRIRHEELARDPAWMEAWFEELRNWVLPRAARAEAAGVEVYIPFNQTEFTFKSGTGYDQLWRELMAIWRGVFSGAIGV